MYETLRNINSIIERDSKDTTYKFALLRGTIEVIQEHSPYTWIDGDRVVLPLGLLVLKWMEYYYPIIKAELPQKNGDNVHGRSLAFRADFKKLTDYYDDRGGLSVFIHEIRRGQVPADASPLVLKVFRKIRNTIIKQPMRYIGKSVNQNEYSIFNLLNNERQLRQRADFDAQYLIEHAGFFSIPRTYFDVFELMGSFVTGYHSILMGWAKFTEEKSSDLSLEHVLEVMLDSPVEARNVQVSSRLFNELMVKNNGLECVWSGKTIKKGMHIDHVLPFSVWRNNDLWNLLPTSAKMNSKKSDKIPSNQLLETSKDRIIGYWEYLRQQEPIGFERELKVSLIRDMDNWENQAFNSLKDKCLYLTETRGFDVFESV